MKLRGAEEEEISGFDTQYFGFGVFFCWLCYLNLTTLMLQPSVTFLVVSEKSCFPVKHSVCSSVSGVFEVSPHAGETPLVPPRLQNIDSADGPTDGCSVC